MTNMTNTLNQFVEIRNATHEIREQLSRIYGGCTVLNEGTFVCCNDATSFSSNNISLPLNDVIIRNELFKTLANSIFIVDRDKNGLTVPSESLAKAHLLINPYVDSFQDSIGYYVNNDGLLIEENGVLLTCHSPVPEDIVLQIKVLLNQESMGLIKTDGLHFV